MTPLLMLTIGVAGGLGAVCRFMLDGVIRPFTGQTGFPWPTILINLTGSFALGLVVGITAQIAAGGLALPAGSSSPAGADNPAQWSLIAGTGFLGGYTTFSTASVDTVQLARKGRWTAAATSAFGVVCAGTAAAGLGLWVGGSW